MFRCGERPPSEEQDETIAPAGTLERNRPALRTAQGEEIRRVDRMGEPAKNLEIARSYLQVLERGETGAAPRRFFAPDVVLKEFPNLLTLLGKKRDLAAALEGAERGKRGHVPPMYEIKKELADDERVALEAEWVGTLAAPFESAGGQVKGFFGVSGVPEKERSSGSGITIVSRPGSRRVEGSTTVLFWNAFLWYRSAIVQEEA